MLQLRSFAQWLPKHAALLKSIYLPYMPDEAEQLLQACMQAVSLQPPAAAAAAAATAEVARVSAAAEAASVPGLEGPAQQQQQQQQGLRLHSFSSSLRKTSGMLALLNVQRLTHVDLDLLNMGPTTDSSALFKALAQLSSLQQLHLHSMSEANHGSALTALAQVHQLTSLRLSGWWPTDTMGRQDGLRLQCVLAAPVAAALQQLLAQPLSLQNLEFGWGFSWSLPVLNMSLLTQLTRFASIDCELPEESVLPAGLQQLACQFWGGADGLAPVTRLQMKQLQHLTLQVCSAHPQPLLQLAQLPSLQHLALWYDLYSYGMTAQSRCRPHAASTAAAWPLLPQLRELLISFNTDHLPDEREWAAICEGLTATTNLTKLQLDPRMKQDGEPFPEWLQEYEKTDSQLVVCACLAALTRLKHLTLGSGEGSHLRIKRAPMKLAPGDALALTALTSLQRLNLDGAGNGVGTAVATALAGSLQQLQHLDLGSCGLQLGNAEGMACLEAIGRLTRLTHLGLSYNLGLAQQSLVPLTGLSRLQQFDVTGWDTIPEKRLQAFWAAVRR
jgi:hypothetical protein